MARPNPHPSILYFIPCQLQQLSAKQGQLDFKCSANESCSLPSGKWQEHTEWIIKWKLWVGGWDLFDRGRIFSSVRVIVVMIPLNSIIPHPRHGVLLHPSISLSTSTVLIKHSGNLMPRMDILNVRTWSVILQEEWETVGKKYYCTSALLADTAAKWATYYLFPKSEHMKSFLQFLHQLSI